LSSKIPIAYIDVRVFAHATEDVDKVLNAVRNVLPAELIDKVVFKKNDLTGHHGNPIILFETRIKEKSASQAVFERLSSSLSILDKEVLQSEFKQHIDKANLYIRLDKQSAFLNQFKLQPTDSIHFRIHFQKSDPEEIVSVCKRFGMLP
jgi:RNA binding exosome subunit